MAFPVFNYNFIQNILIRSISVEKAEIPSDNRQEEDRQKNLAFLLEKVEGCSVSHGYNFTHPRFSTCCIRAFWLICRVFSKFLDVIWCILEI